MQPREKILAIVTAGIVVAIVGYLTVERTVVARFKGLRDRKQILETSVDKLGDEKVAILQADRQIKDWTAISFPPDAVAAQRMYLAWLTDLSQAAGFSSPKLTPERGESPSKVYASFGVKIEASATFQQLCHFLYQFRRTDLLHRVADLTVEGEDGSATSPLKITLIAEGISLKGAAPRETLFPRTELAVALEPSDHRLTVAKSDRFPSQGEFRVRSGAELLKVESVAENVWNVVRGVDGTTASAHKSGEMVELVPILAEWKDRKLEDFAALISQNPFAKPEKPKPPQPPSGPEKKPTVVLDDPAAKTTKFVGSTIVNKDRQVCFLDPASDKRTIVKEGASFSVAGIKGTLVAINANHILIEIEKDKWRLDLGKELASMKKLDAAGNPVPSPSTSSPNPAPPEGGKPASPAAVPSATGDKPQPPAAPNPPAEKDKPASAPQQEEKKAPEVSTPASSEKSAPSDSGSASSSESENLSTPEAAAPSASDSK